MVFSSPLTGQSRRYDRKVDGVRPDSASYLQMIRANGHAEDTEGG